MSSLLPMLVCFAVAFGLVIGSFLNVVIYRVPAGVSVVRPGSACPACGHAIRGFDNIPVVSWLLLRGKCRDCAAPISPRYMVVEAATGALFGLLTWWWLGPEGTPGLVWVWLYLAAVGVALFLIDLDCKRLPDVLVLPSYPVVVAGLVVAGVTGGHWPIVRAVVSALIWGAVFGVPWFITAGRGMGFGDVKLAPVLGLALGWLGWGPSLVGLLGGFLLGAVVGIGLMLAAKAGRKSKVPYGPFMLTGALAAVFVGQPLWHAYLSMMGLA